jgi:hypothetical protein
VPLQPPPPPSPAAAAAAAGSTCNNARLTIKQLKQYYKKRGH